MTPGTTAPWPAYQNARLAEWPGLGPTHHDLALRPAPTVFLAGGDIGTRYAVRFPAGALGGLP
ncbi:hypothetical protein, partial [Bacillus cereus group sp. Bce037]|uniref:hypothetical protein n=1 Tax=Bacillus cereus group sp. Bce037 TaxID=3445232 RepID=UPI003F6A520F